LLTGRLPSIRCFQSAVILAQITGPCRRRLHRVLPWRASCARACNVKSCSAGVPRGRSGGRMLRDGPPRMVARPTWSGRERSSHSRYLPVPRVGLVTPRFCSTSFCSESLGFFCVPLFAVTVCRGYHFTATVDLPRAKSGVMWAGGARWRLPRRHSMTPLPVWPAPHRLELTSCRASRRY
jgi:hypothetical protein